jgi:hypothetical protein
MSRPIGVNEKADETACVGETLYGGADAGRGVDCGKHSITQRESVRHSASRMMMRSLRPWRAAALLAESRLSGLSGVGTPPREGCWHPSLAHADSLSIPRANEHLVGRCSILCGRNGYEGERTTVGGRGWRATLAFIAANLAFNVMASVLGLLFKLPDIIFTPGQVTASRCFRW